VTISSEDAADTAAVAAQLGMPGVACDVTDSAALAHLVAATLDTWAVSTSWCAMPASPGGRAALPIWTWTITTG
jgi:hypothetical protein